MVLNRLIPHVSPLMNQSFVGNALFIPYFLIGVGMIIDGQSVHRCTLLKVAIGNDSGSYFQQVAGSMGYAEDLSDAAE